MKKRTIELFTAGCPCCDEAVRVVRSLICPSCDLQVLDLRSDPVALARARQYGVTRVPAVVVNGELADCCRLGAIDADRLRALGVGTAA